MMNSQMKKVGIIAIVALVAIAALFFVFGRDADPKEYVRFMYGHAERFGEAWFGMVDLLNEGYGSYDIDMWLKDVKHQADYIEELCEEAIKYPKRKVPKGFRDSHELYVDAMKDIQKASNKLPKAIEKEDKPEVAELLGHMEAAYIKMEAHAEMIISKLLGY